MHRPIDPALRRLALILALALAPALPGCGGQPAPAPTPGDPAAARALYDRALIAELSGDTLAAEDLLFELATTHPETTHGRAARARLGGSSGLPATVGILAAVAVPAFARYVERSQATEEMLRDALPVEPVELEEAGAEDAVEAPAPQK